MADEADKAAQDAAKKAADDAAGATEKAKQEADAVAKAALDEAKAAKDEAARLKASLEKANTAFQKQSTEVGELRKQLEQKKDQPAKVEDPAQTDDEVLDSLTDDEATQFNALLDAAGNAELKKRVVEGGKKAMSEFVRSVRENRPVDLKSPVFGKKPDKARSAKADSVGELVKNLFRKEQDKNAKNYPAAPDGSLTPGASERKGNEPHPQVNRVTGGVTDVRGFFERKK